MIVININGQLGNQMFQYALGRRLQLMGRKVEYYIEYFDKNPNHFFGLPLFPIVIPLASKEKVLSLRDDQHRVIDRIRRKIIGRRPHVISEIGADSYVFMENVFHVKTALIDGYWQSEKYFSEIRSTLLSDFRFPISQNELNQDTAKEMSECISISIHVRRGDYLGSFPVMDCAYYNPAMCYFREKYGRVRFYVFSNDLRWCKENLIGDDVKYVEWNTGKNSIFDMWLMTQCKHNIIANSSFSWWGAWLNEHEGSEVIAPSQWFNGVSTPEVYCKGWKII